MERSGDEGASASLETTSSVIDKYINGLVDPLASKRLEALKNIEIMLLGLGGKAAKSSGKETESRSAQLDPQALPHLVEEVVAKPLLRRFADPSEKCRFLSIYIISELNIKGYLWNLVRRYVLNAFNDENNEMQELAFDLMECIGQQYEKENEDEVKDVKQYLPEDIETIKKGFHMPSFLKRRPCLGARIMVRRSFGILLRALSADIQAWQQEPKVLAAQLLYVLIMFVEENATMHLQSLILTITKACSDALVEKKIRECAQLLGFFVDPSSYLEILIPRINGEYNADASIQDMGKALKVLSWIMQGSQRVLLGSYIPEICSMLTDQDLMTSLHQEVHESILSILEVMVAAFDESCNSEVIAILWILLNAYAVGEIIKKPCHERIECALEKLSKSLGFEKNGDLIVTYMDDVMNLLLPPQLWSSHSLDAMICSRLLEEASLMDSATLEKLFKMVKEFRSLRAVRMQPTGVIS